MFPETSLEILRKVNFHKVIFSVSKETKFNLVMIIILCSLLSTFVGLVLSWAGLFNASAWTLL